MVAEMGMIWRGDRDRSCPRSSCSRRRLRWSGGSGAKERAGAMECSTAATKLPALLSGGLRKMMGCLAPNWLTDLKLSVFPN